MEYMFYLNLIVVALIISLGNYIFYKDPSNRTNKAFLILSIFESYWIFTRFGLGTAMTKEQTQMWYVLSAFGYLLLSAVFHFILVFTNKHSKKINIVIILNYLIAFVISLIDLNTTLLRTELELSSEGHWVRFAAVKSPVYILTNIWMICIVICSVFLLVRYYFIAKNIYQEKQKTKIVLIGISIPMVTGVISQIILPLMGIISINMLTASLFAGNLFIAYALWKHELFFDKVIRDKNYIFKIIPEAVIITRKNGRVYKVNSYANKMLNYRKSELYNMKFYELLKDQNIKDEIINPATGNIIQTNIETKLISKHDLEIPVSLTITELKDYYNKPAGYIFIVKDISDFYKIKKELIFERNQYHSIFDSIDELIYISDPYTYDILYVNKKFKKIIKEDEPIGKKCYKIIQGLDEPCVFCTNEIILSNREKAYQWEFYNPNLNKNYLITDRIIKWPDNRDVRFEIAIDITKQKDIEGELLKSNILLDQIFNRAAEGIRLIDRNCNILKVNETYAELEGKSISKIEGGKCYNHLSTEMCKTGECVLKRILKGDTDIREEIILEKENNIKIYLSFTAKPFKDKDGDIIGTLENFFDVTTNKLMEKALSKSEMKYRLLADNAADNVWVLNIKTMKYVYVSPSCKELLGFTQEEMLKRSVKDCMSPSTYEWYLTVAGKRRQLFMSNPDDEHSYKDEFELVKKDGTTVWAEVVTRYYLNDRNELEVVGISRDISEKRKAQEELRKTLIELKKKNEDLDHFASIIAHDLKNPLSVVSSGLSLLQNHLIDDPDSLHILKTTKNRATKMFKMIDRLLEYSKLENNNINLRSVETESIIKNAVDNLSIIIKEQNAEINYDNMPTIICDEVLTALVFQNLITNSIKYNNKDKPIINITAEKYTKNNIDYWKFGVADNGIGIEDENKNKIFRIFSRLHTDEEYEGYGVGLSFCKRIIETHGGDIWVESDFDEGSTFYFTIPIK